MMEKLPRPFRPRKLPGAVFLVTLIFLFHAEPDRHQGLPCPGGLCQRRHGGTGSGSLSLLVSLARVLWPRPPGQSPPFPVIGPKVKGIFSDPITEMLAATLLTTGGSPRDGGQCTDRVSGEMDTERGSPKA